MASTSVTKSIASKRRSPSREARSRRASTWTGAAKKPAPSGGSAWTKTSPTPQRTSTEDNLWNAFAATRPGQVKGRSQAGRFADLVALVRFALEQQPVLAPFADSVTERFNEWLMDKAKAGAVFTPEQLARLNLIRDHIATSLSIEPDDLELSPFNQRGGLGKAYQLFGNELNGILDELNLTLVA